MIEGLKIMKKVDDTVKKVSGGGDPPKKDKKSKKDDDKKKKGRPTCKRDEEEEKRLELMKKLTTPQLKFIGMQIEKLENMHIILTAEDGMSKRYPSPWKL